MKLLQTMFLSSATALSVLALSGSIATAGPIVPPGHYCLSYDKGGTDCSFISYAECLETASGIAAECYGKTARDDEHDRAVVPHW